MGVVGRPVVGVGRRAFPGLICLWRTHGRRPSVVGRVARRSSSAKSPWLASAGARGAAVIHGRSGDFGCRRLAALVGREVGALERPTSGHEEARAAGLGAHPRTFVVSAFPPLQRAFPRSWVSTPLPQFVADTGCVAVSTLSGSGCAIGRRLLDPIAVGRRRLHGNTPNRRRDPSRLHRKPRRPATDPIYAGQASELSRVSSTCRMGYVKVQPRGSEGDTQLRGNATGSSPRSETLAPSSVPRGNRLSSRGPSLVRDGWWG